MAFRKHRSMYERYSVSPVSRIIALILVGTTVVSTSLSMPILRNDTMWFVFYYYVDRYPTETNLYLQFNSLKLKHVESSRGTFFFGATNSLNRTKIQHTITSSRWGLTIQLLSQYCTIASKPQKWNLHIRLEHFLRYFFYWMTVIYMTLRQKFFFSDF